jgi:ABC-type bacteriocin/lantibiotic exporter with double-glycine peptidase domain
MTSNYSIIVSHAERLWRHLSNRRKIQLSFSFMLAAFAAGAEMISIGAVFPFLGVLIDPIKVINSDFFLRYIDPLGIDSPDYLLLAVTVIFIFFVVFASAVRLSLVFLQTRISAAICVDLSLSVYERTLYQPYREHVKKNSSEILAGIAKVNGLVNGFIGPLISLVSGLVILTAISATLFLMNTYVALYSILTFSAIYTLVTLVTKSKIAEYSKTIAVNQGLANKSVQEGLGGIRDVILGGTQRIYVSLYRTAFLPMLRAQARIQFIGASPRLVIEGLGLTVIALLAYRLSSQSGQVGGLNESIPLLGLLALGAQRMLPTIQQVYSSYITLTGYSASTTDALGLLGQPMPDRDPLVRQLALPLRSEITFKNVSFAYRAGSFVLNDINLIIKKGARVGFIGKTGCGKSTLLDLIMGLLTPTRGEILVDGINLDSRNVDRWQMNVAHVPQLIFLADSTIAENIAFGVPPDLIDMSQVKIAAQQAQLSTTIESWPDAYSTVVGERGIRLSGGQRQRIGIARALYKRAKVIVLDEATSALDNATESDVMQAISSLSSDVTILIVAHRVTTLKNCDVVIELNEGSVMQPAALEELQVERV